MRAKFKRMRPDAPPPSLPSVQFLANHRFLDGVLDAYCEGENVKWTGTLKGTPLLVAHAMTAGLSREAAIFDVAKGQALLIDREQRNEDIRKASLLYGAAELKNARTRREIETCQKYYGPLRRAERRSAKTNQSEFALTANRDPNAPIMLEEADFSAWDLN